MKTANAVYSREEIVRQAKNDVKYGFSFHPVTYALFMLFALFVDYYSIAPFQDLVLRTNEIIAKALSLSVVFCIDIVVPICLTKLIHTLFKTRKLYFILMISTVASIGTPLLLMIIQKMLGTNIMMPDRGTTAVITPEVKIATQILFSLVPVATTVSLTVMGLLRENVKVFRKHRYIELAKAKVQAEINHLEKILENDKTTLANNDEEKLKTTVSEILAMRDSLFTNARQILAVSIGDPASTETIISSQPVYRVSAEYKQFVEYVLKNPVLKIEQTDTDTPENTGIKFTKEDNINEKMDA